MNLLLAQIGNRHITRHGQVYQKTSDEGALSFRDWSRQLLEEAQSSSSSLTGLGLQILPEFFAQTAIGHKATAHWILFYSDNAEQNSRNDQDTVYAAQLAKLLLEVKYGFSADHIQLEPLQCSPVDIDGLIKRYIHKIRKAQKKLEPQHVFLCDSGATAQMKNSLRETSELVFGHQLQVVQVYDGTTRAAEQISSAQREKVLFLKLAIGLLEKGEIQAAAELLKGSGQRSEKTEKIYDLLIYRSRGFVGLTWRQLNFTVGKEAPSWLIDLQHYQQQHPASTFDLSKRDGFQFTERLLLAQYLLKNNAFEWACLSLNQAIENLMKALMEYQGWKSFKPKDVAEVKEGVIYLEDLCTQLEQYSPAANFLSQHRPDWKHYRHEAMVSKYFMLLMAGPESWNALLQKHIPLLLGQAHANEKYDGVDKIRNKFAHEGKEASPSVQQNLQPLMEAFIADCFQLLQIDQIQLGLDRMRQETIAYLRRYA